MSASQARIQLACIAFLILSTACSEQTKETKKKIVDVDQKSYSVKVIYGDDNRLDYYQVNDARVLKIADSTVALISNNDLTKDGDVIKINTKPFANTFRYPMCETERFYEQETAAFCSGFLVAPNTIVTAGHCVQSQGTPNSDCATTKFVFGFQIKSEGQSIRQVPSSEVYSCKRIIKQKVDSSGADFSVVELDRAVTNHIPLSFRQSGSPNMNDTLTVIGHPSGLPAKIADGASIRSLHNGFIRANLDTYGGNSGSVVFNSLTLDVEGILVRGETDYVLKNGCLMSNVCPQDGCRGEDVTRITEAAPYIPN